MKTQMTIATLVLALVMSAGIVRAADTTIEGTVSGYTCVVLGKACPVDKEDPIIAMEKVFVVVKADGSYFQAPNIDRAVLARHITEKVRLTGKLDEKYKAVQASSLETYVASKDNWKVVWSLAMEDEARKMLALP